jgi:hypothetical protein
VGMRVAVWKQDSRDFWLQPQNHQQPHGTPSCHRGFACFA